MAKNKVVVAGFKPATKNQEKVKRYVVLFLGVEKISLTSLALSIMRV